MTNEWATWAELTGVLTTAAMAPVAVVASLAAFIVGLRVVRWLS